MTIVDIFSKYGPIVILYIFIFRVITFILKDIKGNAPHVTEGENNNQSFLMVVKSDEPHLPEGQRIALRSRVLIGRGSQNDIVINDAFTSHEHAKIVNTPRGFQIQDLSSLNGVYVNENKISKPTILGPKDKLLIGGVTFQFMRWENEVQ